MIAIVNDTTKSSDKVNQTLSNFDQNVSILIMFDSLNGILFAIHVLNKGPNGLVKF